jgi:hypothetical protein
MKMIPSYCIFSHYISRIGSNPERDDDYDDSQFEEKKKRAEAGETMDVSDKSIASKNSSDPSSKIPDPVPSLEESEPEIQQRGLYDEAIGSSGDEDADAAAPHPHSQIQDQHESRIGGSRTPHYGSGNFRRATRYYKPKFLMKASIRNAKQEKLKKSSWHQEPAPEFCNESILIHDECDSNVNSHGRKKDKRWSFNLEDGNCYQYEDPCPLFKRNSFRQLSECLATCWRHASVR